MTREVINELKKYTLGRKNTEKVEINVLQLNRIIKALEQEPKIVNLGDNVVYGTDGNLYKITVSSGKEYEQEPCEDAISRQAVLDIVDSYSESQSNVEDVTQDIISDIVALLPVNPQPKTGYWIEEIDDYGKVISWHCDKCYEDSGFTTDCKWKYCPSCGAKMVEPQESEKI